MEDTQQVLGFNRVFDDKYLYSDFIEYNYKCFTYTLNHQIQPTLSIIQNYPSAINDNQRSNRLHFYAMFNEDVNVILHQRNFFKLRFLILMKDF